MASKAKKPSSATPAQKRPPGRPTLYRPEFCERFVELSSQGKLVVEIAAEFGVVRQVFTEWKAQHPEFMDAFTRGRELCEAWHAREGLRRIYDGESWGQAGAWAKVMASMFKGDWVSTTKHEHGGADGGPLVIYTGVLRDDDDAAAD